ncbi:hypothetical protein B0J13DRAFT_529574 [Dactylonectria estremocensis]|uniref:Uncharacterized protein n=1 Tax=Dactylonectria estremocensis TaxID=1079267 RepID=A0A9P9IT99_9HYPO|nr:hypothetical protein B0J13DRAFT_529574 [Dactylonectria estremocensis]
MNATNSLSEVSPCGQKPTISHQTPSPPQTTSPNTFTIITSAPSQNGPLQRAVREPAHHVPKEAATTAVLTTAQNLVSLQGLNALTGRSWTWRGTFDEPSMQSAAPTTAPSTPTALTTAAPIDTMDLAFRTITRRPVDDAPATTTPVTGWRGGHSSVGCWRVIAPFIINIDDDKDGSQ